MNDLKLFFPFASDVAIDAMSSSQPSENVDLPRLNEEISKVYDKLYPFSEVSGSRSGDVSRLLNPAITALEKERIMSTMSKMPASKRHNLSDSELISMLPSRYNSTLTDSDKVRDYFEKEILPSFEDSDDSTDSVHDSTDSAGDDSSSE